MRNNISHISLPDLPRTVRRKEADAGVLFRKWWEAHPIPGTFELKYAHDNRVSFNAVEEDQIAFAKMAQGKKGVLARVTTGTTGCSDYIGLVQSPVWIVLKYAKSFEILSLDSWLMEAKHSKRRSLTAERARAISTISIDL